MTGSIPEDLALRHDPYSVGTDAARAGLGLAACLGPLLLMEPMAWIEWILIGGTVLFLFFAIKTLDRWIGRTRISATEIRQTGLWTRRLEWEAVTKVRLSYFGKKRGGGSGQMTLSLSDGRNRVSVDGALDRFDDLARAVAILIRAKGIDIDAATAHNFSVLGHRLEGE